MNRQATFSRVRAHLLAQGHRSVFSGQCQYRGADGDRCAIGALLPDALYTEDMEGHSAHYIVSVDFNGIPRFPGVREALGVEEEGDGDFLDALQAAHDSARDADAAGDFKRSLAKVAADYALENV